MNIFLIYIDQNISGLSAFGLFPCPVTFGEEILLRSDTGQVRSKEVGESNQDSLVEVAMPTLELIVGSWSLCVMVIPESSGKLE